MKKKRQKKAKITVKWYVAAGDWFDPPSKKLIWHEVPKAVLKRLTLKDVGYDPLFQAAKNLVAVFENYDKGIVAPLSLIAV